MQEVEIVEVERDNLLLSIVAFELHGNNPLYRLLQQALQRTLSRFRIELFGKLLRNGRATAGRSLTKEPALNHSTSKGNEVDTRMVVESGILCSHKSVYEVRRQVAVRYADTVLAVEVPCTNHLAVGTVNLCGKTIYRILQVLDWRHIANPTVPYSRESQSTDNKCKDKHNP